MVKNSRTKKRTGQIRALNLPDRVEVEEDDEGAPVAVGLGPRRRNVVSIEDVWEVEDEWWRPRPISRRYFQALLEEGPVITLFWDKVDGLWYKQRA